jgi:hypothetical protein
VFYSIQDKLRKIHISRNNPHINKHIAGDAKIVAIHFNSHQVTCFVMQDGQTCFSQVMWIPAIKNHTYSRVDGNSAMEMEIWPKFSPSQFTAAREPPQNLLNINCLTLYRCQYVEYINYLCSEMLKTSGNIHIGCVFYYCLHMV